jgi:hypothetical protein
MNILRKFENRDLLRGLPQCLPRFSPAISLGEHAISEKDEGEDSTTCEH